MLNYYKSIGQTPPTIGGHYAEPIRHRMYIMQQYTQNPPPNETTATPAAMVPATTVPVAVAAPVMGTKTSSPPVQPPTPKNGSTLDKVKITGINASEASQAVGPTSSADISGTATDKVAGVAKNTLLEGSTPKVDTKAVNASEASQAVGPNSSADTSGTATDKESAGDSNELAGASKGSAVEESAGEESAGDSNELAGASKGSAGEESAGDSKELTGEELTQDTRTAAYKNAIQQLGTHKNIKTQGINWTRLITFAATMAQNSISNIQILTGLTPSQSAPSVSGTVFNALSSRMTLNDISGIPSIDPQFLTEMATRPEIIPSIPSIDALSKIVKSTGNEIPAALLKLPLSIDTLSKIVKGIGYEIPAALLGIKPSNTITPVSIETLQGITLAQISNVNADIVKYLRGDSSTTDYISDAIVDTIRNFSGTGPGDDASLLSAGTYTAVVAGVTGWLFYAMSSTAEDMVPIYLESTVGVPAVYTKMLLRSGKLYVTGL